MTLELPRLAAGLDDCSGRLRSLENTDESPEVLRVRRILGRTAAGLAAHAGAIRRLDDEIDLALRRHAPAPELAELENRRRRAVHRMRADIDTATTSLIPGGDRLAPATIMRRLTGAHASSWSYFGRPPVDRTARVRRLTAALLNSQNLTWTRPRDGRPTHTTMAARAARLTRLRHRLRPTSTDTGARS